MELHHPKCLVAHSFRKSSHDPLRRSVRLVYDSICLSEVTDDKGKSIVAAAIEHLAIAKGFGRKNGYTIDQSQELVYLGTTNFCTYRQETSKTLSHLANYFWLLVNSFFSSMAVGGAMSRTAVNSSTGVKSPAGKLLDT